MRKKESEDICMNEFDIKENVHDNLATFQNESWLSSRWKTFSKHTFTKFISFVEYDPYPYLITKKTLVITFMDLCKET